jgi:hypothetical protein
MSETISGKQLDAYAVDTKQLVSGIYYLIITTGNHSESFKFIKE